MPVIHPTGMRRCFEKTWLDPDDAHDLRLLPKKYDVLLRKYGTVTSLTWPLIGQRLCSFNSTRILPNGFITSGNRLLFLCLRKKSYGIVSEKTKIFVSRNSNNDRIVIEVMMQQIYLDRSRDEIFRNTFRFEPLRRPARVE